MIRIRGSHCAHISTTNTQARSAADGGAGRPCSGEGDQRRRLLGPFNLRREALLAPALCLLTLGQLPCVVARAVVDTPSREAIAAIRAEAAPAQCAGALDCVNLLIEYFDYLVNGTVIDPEIIEACLGDDDEEPATPTTTG